MKKPSSHARKHKSKPDRGPERHQSKSRSEGQRKPRFAREVRVLYEDDAVVVLDKPPGLLSVPIKGSNTPSALSLASESLKARRQRALVVHRIDRFASGILLFAKTNSDRDALIQQFLAHTPLRQYLAVVRGRLRDQAGKLVHFFQREGMFQQLRTAKDPRSTRAELDYTVERAYHDATLVRVRLVTGLQNQIRVQFAAISHPLIGDRKYHRAEAQEQMIERVALHAAHLEFSHPRSGKMIRVDCPPPEDFQHLLRKLERPGRSSK